MVVRFVPAEDVQELRSDRLESDLAEVIDFRSRLKGVSGVSEAADSQPVDSDASANEDMAARSAPMSVLRLVKTGQGTDYTDGAGDLPGETEPAAEQEFSGSNTPAENIPPRTAYDDAVRMLARRARSSGELARELQQAGHSLLDVEIVIDEFNDRLYLDDDSLARTLTEKLRDGKGASRSHIRQKLRERLLSDAAIEQALAELDEAEELELLRDAAFDRARKLGGLDRVTAERRLLGFLARRGWSGQSVHQVVREALDGKRSSNGVRFE